MLPCQSNRQDIKHRSNSRLEARFEMSSAGCREDSTGPLHMELASQFRLYKDSLEDKARIMSFRQDNKFLEDMQLYLSYWMGSKTHLDRVNSR